MAKYWGCPKTHLEFLGDPFCINVLVRMNKRHTRACGELVYADLRARERKFFVKFDSAFVSEI